jgi:hypothetical protein
MALSSIDRIAFQIASSVGAGEQIIGCEGMRSMTPVLYRSFVPQLQPRTEALGAREQRRIAKFRH